MTIRSHAILFLDVAIVDHLLRIYYIHCLPAAPDALTCYISEWSPCTCINVLASDHVIKLINTGNRTCHFTLDRWTIGNKRRSLILNCIVIIAYSIATFSNCMLNLPVKIHGYGSHLSATGYDITSKWHCATLGLIEMHGNG